ncbi:hypothetical protein [Eubacterium coprostanoligenes]|uniref:hypothetical protein n=1 Tax=Eubacterium coprostanoligenes TaxID=290054 RepID=UPI00235343A1|nr:hypothetical protein [Eubacterium coprostanoligenes]MCI6253316.1 hypothetical protein [Eubacterium coprostanoligenes]
MLLLSVVVLLVGIAVAYYNTASLGYDNANLLTVTNESIRIFDITIKYEDIIMIFKKIEKVLNFKPIVI